MNNMVLFPLFTHSHTSTMVGIASIALSSITIYSPWVSPKPQYGYSV